MSTGASELLSESDDPYLVTLSSLIGVHLLSSLSLTSAVVELVWGESDWTLYGGQPGLVASQVVALIAAQIGCRVVAAVTEHCREGDEV